MRFLLQPYPYNYRYGTNTLKLAGIVCAVVWLFLYSFEPVGITNDNRYDLLVTCGIYGLLAGGLFFALTRLSNWIITGITKPVKWRFINELMLMLLLIIATATANFFIGHHLMTANNELSLTRYIGELQNAFLVGIIPIGIIFTYNVVKLLQGEELTIPAENQVTITANIVNDQLTFDAKQLLYAKADGNYVEFYLLSADGSPHKSLLRTTLQQVQAELNAYDFIVQTHRSYLVNTCHVGRMSGNAQRAYLTLNSSADKPPVSRSYYKEIKGLFPGR